MENIISSERLIACCGLYCGNCSKLKKGSCFGCAENVKASWCKIRTCCIAKNISTCAECADFPKPGDCKKYNNVFSKVIQFVTKTDRALCIDMIRKDGPEKFISYMTENGMMSIPKANN